MPKADDEESMEDEANGHQSVRDKHGGDLRYLWDKVAGKVRKFRKKDNRAADDEYEYEYEYVERPPCFIFFLPIPTYRRPGCFERNCCCTAIGTWGCIDDDDDDDEWAELGDPAEKVGCFGVCPSCTKGRKPLFCCGTFLNCIAAVLTFFACFSISDQYGLLHNFPFSAGTVVTSIAVSNGNAVQKVDLPAGSIDIGLAAVAIKDVGGYRGETVLDFDDFCSVPHVDPNAGSNANATADLNATAVDRVEETIATLVEFFVPDDVCDMCADSSDSFVVPCILSMLTMVPTLTTDVLRIYKHYDANCQKVIACFISAITALLSLRSLVGYSNDCYDAFYQGEHVLTRSNTSALLLDTLVKYYSDNSSMQSLVPETFVGFQTNLTNGTLPEGMSVDITIDFDWSAGRGMVFLTLATILRAIDVVFHCFVKTPSITRDKQKQKLYGVRSALSPPTDSKD